PVLFVIVVGEKARAAEFWLDGYNRETNPDLRQDKVINFPHVDACATSTADSLPCMFSSFAKSDFDAEKGRRYESLLDVVQHAGMRVIWRDNNSGCKHVCDGVVTQLLDKEQIAGVCQGGECFDEVLLEGWDELAAGDDNLLVVLHQKGSHGPAYYKRYPKEFERFTPACKSEDFDQCTQEEIRNAYDNSILYTDHVLGQVIARLAASRDRDTAMLYVSDHGESLGENGLYLHGLPMAIAPDTQKHVPMVLWMSPGFASRFEIDAEELTARASRPYSHDNLFHSVLGILDIRTRVYDPALDFTHGPGHRIAAR
ncbi:MAG TPA: sulfatase-like hydrolase/transferase, partial [Thermoanaerobaculia bacterium]|nr:sulfatase-like hydrolase/transferase [Thermoanaerobaculia bacterium]